MFDVPTSKDSCGGSTEPVLDRLDTFPDAIDPGNTLRRLFLRVGVGWETLADYRPEKFCHLISEIMLQHIF